MKHKKHKSGQLHHRAASIDGIIPSSGRLGERPVNVYRPNQGTITPSLGEYMRRADGFHSSSSGLGAAAEPLKLTPEAAETEKLVDETIVLDDYSQPPKKSGLKSRRRRAFSVIKRTLLVLVVIGLLVGGFLGWKFQHNISKVFHGNIFSLLHSTKLKGEDQGRVTILLAGNSADDVGHSGAELTDSIMLLSIDTVHNNGYILSIPRDLWVNYNIGNCQFGNSGKINATYECGQMANFSQSGFPNGGMGLLEKVVNKDFGVNIGYYALIDYSALRDGVNAVGGVNFTVNSDDPRGIYDPSRDYTTHGPLVKLTNGVHLLNGQQALDLSRARGDAYGSYGFPQADFNRTQNQRQMLLSLKSKILSFGTLSNPAKISSLLDALGNNVHTDFHVDEIKRLYDLTKNIPNNNIQSIGLADANINLVTTGSVGDQSVVLPTAGVGNFTQIQAYIRRVTSNDPVVKESATAVVLNGSGVNGLANKTAGGLTNRGLVIKNVNNDTARPSTVVIELNPKKTATNDYLQKKFGVTSTTSVAAYPEAKYYSVDFVIILGANASSSQ